MREIKFRAWVPKGYVRWGGSGMIMLSWEELLVDLHSEINPKKSVMGIGMSHQEAGVVFTQFTGLHDKNGKEIYEGDILLYTKQEKGMGTVKHYYEVFFARGQWLMRRGFIDKGLPVLIEQKLYGKTDTHEIAGNSFEHPELLKP